LRLAFPVGWRFNVAVAAVLPFAVGVAATCWERLLLRDAEVFVAVFPPQPASSRVNRISAEKAYHFLSVKYLIHIEIPFFRVLESFFLSLREPYQQEAGIQAQGKEKAGLDAN